MEDGEKRFNQLSIEERGKFDEETLVNVNSIKRQSTSSKRSNGFSNEYIVVRLILKSSNILDLLFEFWIERLFAQWYCKWCVLFLSYTQCNLFCPPPSKNSKQFFHYRTWSWDSLNVKLGICCKDKSILWMREMLNLLMRGKCLPLKLTLGCMVIF